MEVVEKGVSEPEDGQEKSKFRHRNVKGFKNTRSRKDRQNEMRRNETH